ncbi:5-formyltetrahydrofolate cyclo-ligase [Streptococcus dentasini]
MLKSELRRSVLLSLRQQDRVKKAEIDSFLYRKLIKTQEYQKAQIIATYLPFDFEYDTLFLINQAQEDRKTVLIPKTYPNSRMIFTEYNPNSLKKTHFGLLEPINGEAIDKEHIDLIHVPGVAFNPQGYRIGYGAGFYDRYLKDFQGATISTIYPCQEANFLPDKHDIPVRKVLTYAKRF